MEFIELIKGNSEWVFSGIGIPVLAYLLNKIRTNNNDKTEVEKIQINNNIINKQNNLELTSEENRAFLNKTNNQKSIQERKQIFKILFIDDDTKFKVVKILNRSGWIHTKIIKDAETLEIPEIIDADLIFVDIQNVGVALGFNDEGLGLSLALKRKYPKKKIVIYSAESQGNRFHQALQKADASLEKNADPYEFQKLVEDFSEEFYK